MRATVNFCADKIARVIIFRIIVVYIANYDENHFFDDVYCADGMSK